MIKVASYNMRKGIGLDRRRDPGRVLSVLGELDADIVALQEADRRFGTRASAIPPHMFEDHSDYVPVDLLSGRPYAIGWHGNALLVRKGAEVEESHALHLPTLEPRGAVAATIRIGDDAAARRRHAPRHFGPPPPPAGARDPDSRRRGRAIADDPDGRLQRMARRAAAVSPISATRHRLVDTGHSFHSRRPVAKLDRIFATPTSKRSMPGVHRSPLAARASDHLPIWARFKAAD